jgi:hypothetical protein
LDELAVAPQIAIDFGAQSFGRRNQSTGWYGALQGSRVCLWVVVGGVVGGVRVVAEASGLL